MSISNSHVLWAYDRHLWEWWNQGDSLSAIRRRLNEECGLGVGVAGIRDVLRAGNPGGTIYNGEGCRPLPPRHTGTHGP